jgi:Predicted transcriptional regulators
MLQEINERFKLIRKDKKLSQEKLGKLLKITKSAISRIESGQNGVSDQNIYSMCRELNVNENWLRHGISPIYLELKREEEITAWASKITRNDSNNPFIQEFAHVLTQLDTEDWKTLEKIVNFFAKKTD